MLDELHVVSKDNQGYNHYTYEISAVIEDGRATTIIVVDRDIQGQDGSWAEGLDDDVFLSDRTGMDRLYKLTRNKVTVHDNGGLSFEFTVQNKNNNNDLLGTNGYTADGTLPVVFDYVVWRLVDGEWTQKMEIKDAGMTLEPGQRGSYKLWVGDDIQDKNFLGKDVSRVRVEITDIRVGTGTFTPDEGTMTIGVTDPDSQLVKILANGNELNLDKVTRALAGSGTYTVNLAPGAYTLTAELVDDTTHRVAIAPATVTIVKDGSVNVTVTVTEIDNSISFTGSAVEGTNFTYVKNDDGTYTITAVNGALGVKAYAVENCTVASVAGTATVMNSTAFTQWTVTPDAGAETVTVKVNKMKAEFTGDKLVSVEVDPDAPADYSVGPRSRAAAGGNEFFYVTFQGLTVDGVEDPTYTVASKPGEEGLFFGADFTAEMRDALIAALNDFTGSDMNLELDSNVSQEDQDAWQGEPDVEIKVEITGTEPPYGITISWDGEEPTEEQKIAAINAQLEKDEKEERAVAIIGTTVFGASDKKIGALTSTANHFVYVNGVKATKADGTAYTFKDSDKTPAKIFVGDVNALYLVDEADPKVAGCAVTGIGDNKYINFDPTGLTADVKLVPGYKMPKGTVNTDSMEVTKVNYEGTDYNNTSDDLYFPVNAEITLTGKTTTNNADGKTQVWLTVGGTKVAGTEKAVAKTANTYTLTLDSKVVSGSGDVKAVAEGGDSVNKIVIGSFSCNVVGSLTSPTIDILPSMLENLPTAGNYMVKAADAPDYTDDGDAIVTVAVTETQIRITGALTANDGVVELVPVTKITFANEAYLTPNYQIGMNSMENVSDGDMIYVKTGVAVNFKAAEGTKIMVTVNNTDNTKDKAEEMSGISYNVPAMGKDQTGVTIAFLAPVGNLTLKHAAITDNAPGVKDVIAGNTGVVAAADPDPKAKDGTLTFVLEAANGYYIPAAGVKLSIEAGVAAQGKNTLKTAKGVVNEDGNLEVTVTYEVAAVADNN